MSVLPDSLDRYRKFISFMLKYWQSDLLQKTASNAMEEDEENKDYDFEQTPEELVEDLKNMGPTYVKLGQLLSTRPDLLPDAYLKELATLQDDVAPIPYEEVHKIVEEEIGTRISKAFDTFDEKPLASASIGQVHYATLRSRQPVAVKIQRPGIKKKFLEDLDTLKEIADLAVRHTKTARKYSFDHVLEELSRIVLYELDYYREAQNLKTLGRNLSEFPDLIVPQPIDDYCTGKVLTMEYIQGKKITSLSPLKQLEVDYSPLVDQLVEAYLKQIINDGFVHADPHPGNIQFTPDAKIALIDLGMVARFTPQMQENILQLLIAISNTNGAETANVLIGMSEYDEETDLRSFRKAITNIIMESDHSTAKDLQTGRLVIHLNRLSAESGIQIPVELNILGKILLNMDQIVAVLDPDFDLREAIKRHVTKIMQTKVYEELKPENFFTMLLQSKKLAEHAPERLNKISENLANNNFKIKIEAIDEKRVTDGFQKVANRITLGLIIAAMIVGAAMLMQVPSNFMILGYPGLAMLFFLLAALGGMYISYIIIFKDENLNNKD
ncbi:AarF/UbiB family protein [Salegentibacter sp. F188]|uniref:AarF/UbiB family protein n=1 Tax=Autumnicola patrickiae TaxID=3075591 RepID=A0ABU3E1K4_9FLAO|nr:AarF/UbiB family protein [Salegentibacter sp. F188]MDT0689856.1 AarF/UbiB family protein [Salegentibacter sp. F188]